jgi:LemA protein
MNATSINDKIQTEQQLTTALQGLKVSLEAYPDLKANQNFLQLLPMPCEKLTMIP